MNHRYLVLIIAILIGFQPVFAQDNDEVTVEETVIAEETSADAGPGPVPKVEYDIPNALRNNQFYLESERLATLAQESYDYGDYDASTEYARQAMYYAMLSDVHVAISVAKSRIDGAVASGASKQYPVEFREAESWYATSLSARDAEQWDESIDAAHRVIALLAYIGGDGILPATYTVREWVTFRDCFWNIAERSWAYADPFEWRRLYEANKEKLPDPNNPNLIAPGTVLDIPSLKGEVRQGEWDSGRTYPAIQ